VCYRLSVLVAYQNTGETKYTERFQKEILVEPNFQT
jgi:hypothetical protein